MHYIVKGFFLRSTFNLRSSRKRAEHEIIENNHKSEYWN